MNPLCLKSQSKPDANLLPRPLLQLPGGDPVQPHPRPQGLPLLRRAALQGHLLADAESRPAVHLAGQHAGGEQLAVGGGRLEQQPLRSHAADVHLLPGLGRLQLHLPRDAQRLGRGGEWPLAGAASVHTSLGLDGEHLIQTNIKTPN